MTRAGMDCAECRALLALLVSDEDRARWEIRSLTAHERAALAQAARRLAELCEELGAARPG